jgi:PAS domain S-box-containing protein
MWDEGQFRIFGVDPKTFAATPASVQALLHPGDIDELRKAMAQFNKGTKSYEAEFRIVRPDGEVRWCVGTAAATVDKGGRVIRVSGVTVDITERKRAEERQNLLAREVDHRAKNALALAQSIVRLTRGDNVKAYVQAVEGRISALARVHTILSLSSWQGAEIAKLVDEELAPYAMGDQIAWATRSPSAARISSCSPRPHRRWRWRCTNWSPIRRNTARCRHCPAASPSSGKSRPTSCRWCGKSGMAPPSKSRRRADSAQEA